MKCQIFNSQNGQEGQTASACQISSKSLEMRLFLIFQDGGCHRFDFRNFEFLTVEKRSIRSNFIRVPNFIKIARTIPRCNDFLIFPRWRLSAILALSCVCRDHLGRAFGGLYHCAKLGRNRCSSFDNMRVFRFSEFGLKTLIHGPKNCFWGFLPPKWGTM